MYFVKVIVPLYLPKSLDYKYEEGTPKIGELVEVQVGRAKVTGLIQEISAEPTFSGKIKAAKPTGYFLDKNTFKFFSWITQYNIAFPGESLRACLISNELPVDKNYKDVLDILDKNAAKITSHRQTILELVEENPNVYSRNDISKKLEISSSVIKTMIEKGFLKETKIKVVNNLEYKSPTSIVELNDQQQEALNVINGSIDSNVFTPILLDGVTGSGKTEVFFKAIDKILQENEDAQCLVLLPEISLTPQLLKRFEDHFGFSPASYHSGMTKNQKSRTWHNVLNGSARVIIGARSALFLPFKNLKFIVVDEEHDNSFKQEDNFKYNARDMAIVRAKIGHFPIVLASATPSLQTWFNAQNQRFQHVVLSSRYGNAKMPDIKLIDMKTENTKSDHFISNTLKEKLEENLKNKNQSLIFLNRRGNAPLLICRACGLRYTCSKCDAYMVVHGHKLMCHHCGLSEPYPEKCPSCDSEKLFAFGVGTRKLYKELKEYFPNANIALADTDIIKSNVHMSELISQVENNEVDILIGTQMIAKGLNFKELTLVGIVDADMGLNNSDLRAAEQTFQLISQVAGRAGRYSKKGHVYLQSYMPDHEIFEHIIKLDRDAFFNLELKHRKFGNYPPFYKLVAILIKSKNQKHAMGAATSLARNFPEIDHAEILGPAPATIFKVNDVYRFKILVKSKNHIHPQIKKWIGSTSVAKDVRIDIDVDPQTLY